MNLKEFIASTSMKVNKGQYETLRPKVRCKDGTSISVQASRSHYCSPRESFLPSYVTVEVFSETPMPISWKKYDCGGVYAFVPLHIVQEFISRHGGLDEERMFGRGKK